jgi:UDP-N-acetylmuramoylalanine--D-glutamate ligase
VRISQLEDRSVALWGWGRESRAAYAALRSRLPTLALTAICSEAEAVDVHALDDPLLQPSLQADTDALAAFEVVIKSPGISSYQVEVEQAQMRGTRFTSGTALWFAERPDAHVIAITGTKGKSTTSAMAAHIARSLGVRTALAGNIGLPLLELLDGDAELWIVELSSFQTGEATALDVGVITNLYEEHLDWHGSHERYAADKLKLAGVARTVVVNASQSDLLARTATHPHRVLFGDTAGWNVRDGDLYRGGAVMDPLLMALNHLPGMHNALNACAALAALDAMLGFDGERALDAAHSLASFRGLPHRLQMLGTHDRHRWINDSISTTPEATLAALHSLHGQWVTVIVGGYDRGLNWSSFAAAVSSWPGLSFIAQGANGARIAQLLRDANASPGLIHETADIAQAVELARKITPTDGTILLSPGAPSFDQFRDYAERGRAFARLAGFDPDAIAQIEGMGIA